MSEEFPGARVLWKRLWANGTASKAACKAIAADVIDELIEAGYLRPDRKES